MHGACYEPQVPQSSQRHDRGSSDSRYEPFLLEGVVATLRHHQ